MVDLMQVFSELIILTASRTLLGKRRHAQAGGACLRVGWIGLREGPSPARQVSDRCSSSGPCGRHEGAWGECLCAGVSRGSGYGGLAALPW